MLVLNPLKKIMIEYRRLLERYEPKLEQLQISDYKRLIGEVRLFWYRNKNYIDYFLSNIDEEDKVAFLAGAVKLDVVNNGHMEYIMVGKYRLINDPLVKFASFYHADNGEISFKYTNSYLNECIQDMLIVFREYADDFYFLPMEFIDSMQGKEYYTMLSDAAQKIVLSMFTVEYEDMQQLYDDNDSYEDIETKLLPHVKAQLAFNELGDIQLSLREKCQKYVQENKKIMPALNDLEESVIFYVAVSQYCMQVLSIIMIMKNYHIIPFIRNDITFLYFSMIYHSNIINEFSAEEYMNTYIPYVVQKAFDFSDMGYHKLKGGLGNGKLIDVIIASFDNEYIPFPNEIVRCVEAYMQCDM